MSFTSTKYMIHYFDIGDICLQSILVRSSFPCTTNVSQLHRELDIQFVSKFLWQTKFVSNISTTKITLQICIQSDKNRMAAHRWAPRKPHLQLSSSPCWRPRWLLQLGPTCQTAVKMFLDMN
jgi:hypothetical protein